MQVRPLRPARVAATGNHLARLHALAHAARQSVFAQVRVGRKGAVRVVDQHVVAVGSKARLGAAPVRVGLGFDDHPVAHGHYGRADGHIEVEGVFPLVRVGTHVPLRHQMGRAVGKRQQIDVLGIGHQCGVADFEGVLGLVARPSARLSGLQPQEHHFDVVGSQHGVVGQGLVGPVVGELGKTDAHLVGTMPRIAGQQRDLTSLLVLEAAQLYGVAYLLGQGAMYDQPHEPRQRKQLHT